MKLLTENLIRDKARVKANLYADVGIKNFPSLNPEGFKNDSIHFKQGFILGAQEAQEFLLESASEGFEEWFNSENELEADIDGFNKVDSETAEIIWQASSISNAKKMQEKDTEIESLTKEKDAWKLMYQELKNRVVGV